MSHPTGTGLDDATREGARHGTRAGTHAPASAATRPVIELDHVTIELAGRTVLEDVSLSIGAGEFIGVLGANGAGKTTLMRALLGLVEPVGGSIRILGKPASRGNPAIGYMPQIRATLAERRLRGRDFVACALDGHRWGMALGRSARVRRQVDAALARVGALELAERPLISMSGGERQRLLLAQCLLGEPGLLLLDEPLISLDPHHQQATVDLVHTLQREFGITVLFSAHELNPLLHTLDRVLYLGRGQAALGTVDEVINGPVLSKLYGSRIDVMRLGGRIFVMSGASDLEHDEHRHEGDCGGAHAHDHDHAHDALHRPAHHHVHRH
ncbi:metal ABC transporter ATP-binding protein [Pararobbsia silviterrae]|uniref:ATP-binding cassette domain-containing protein n=1 Tax=Pararobbsia silviterrae TaxID=1792498 RepID=A0A494YG56_9BURK|nr:ATP-binding cassette domain-containing protein [Pararobbsia silviterrae]RKP59017.1 ATP-binding cassette domain-containing protein [Pararobbsia silviterrae]